MAKIPGDSRQASIGGLAPAVGLNGFLAVTTSALLKFLKFLITHHFELQISSDLGLIPWALNTILDSGFSFPQLL
ncbi:MAG TPA: hypothetical protein DCY59_02240 [Micrococcaceae bacterium]|nr:hypothetical protein [Micrococcaceae bacterium]